MRSIRTIVTIILISLGVSAVFWTVSSVACVAFGEGSFLDEFFSPDKHHLWMRIPVVIISVPMVALIVWLTKSITEVKMLKGLIPICAWCGKKIRDEKGNWKRVEEYISEHSTAEFTHGMCPACVEKYRAEEDNKKNASSKVS